jgi:hypothetical protein
MKRTTQLLPLVTLLTFVGILVSFALIVPVLYAQDSSSITDETIDNEEVLQSLMSNPEKADEIRTMYEELRVKVENKEFTTDEANEQWDIYIEELDSELGSESEGGSNESPSDLPGKTKEERVDDQQIIKDKISDLRGLYEELKEKVESGELTKEEARKEWKELVFELRKEKEIRFDQRFDMIKERAKRIGIVLPDRMFQIIDRIENKNTRRFEMEQLRIETKIKNEKKEILGESARDLLRRINKELN